jgi:hypothetical protein
MFAILLVDFLEKDDRMWSQMSLIAIKAVKWMMVMADRLAMDC